MKKMNTGGKMEFRVDKYYNNRKIGVARYSANDSYLDVYVVLEMTEKEFTHNMGVTLNQQIEKVKNELNTFYSSVGIKDRIHRVTISLDFF